MTCEELMELIPDLVDGSLEVTRMAEALAILPGCPQCQRELEIATQVHNFLMQFQAENAAIKLSPGFEARLLRRIRQQGSNLDLVDLLSKTFGETLVELINLLGGLVVPSQAQAARSSGFKPQARPSQA